MTLATKHQQTILRRPPLSKRGPLRAMFVITSMPVGGAETLLVNLVRRVDRERIQPMICCLKQKDELGDRIANEIPIFEKQINHKFDIAVAQRLKYLLRENKIDAVITVGAGDKMFWGRLAARWARVPVVLSALHSTGWPDGVGRLNRMLSYITDGFIAVADQHARFLIEQEKFPPEKVFVIPNGIDCEQFRFDARSRSEWRTRLSIPQDSPVVGIVAALRPEKNHCLFVESAEQVLRQLPTAHFVIAGNGNERPKLEQMVAERHMLDHVHFLGSVDDVPGVLSMMDVFALTSQNEASPVSILEAMACSRPVVAPDVGSISESVLDGKTGFLVRVNDGDQTAARWMQLLNDPETFRAFGADAREHVMQHGSLSSMADGYAGLIERIYSDKFPDPVNRAPIADLDPGVTTDACIAHNQQPNS